MLALSYALEGIGPEGELAYPPALPGLMLVVRRVADGDTSTLFWLVKAVALLCLLVEALGLAALAGTLAGRAAASWTFVLAAWNPSSWNQVLWGGYAQMLAVGLGGLGLALLLQSRERLRWLAGVFFGAVVLTHPYSAVFFGVAFTSFVISRRLWRALPAVIVAVVVALPSVSAYSVLLGDLSFGRSGEAYAVGLFQALQNVVYHPAINVLMVCLLVLAIRTGARANHYVWPFLVACGLLVFVTPPIHVARAGAFAWHGAVLFMGISFALATASKLRLAVLCLLPIVSYAELTTLIGDFAPLRQRHASAMATLAKVAQGRTLVVSRTPNVDGWWYEGLTGKPALIGDDLRWSLLGVQQDRSVAAQTIVHATDLLDGGATRLLTLELPGEEPVSSFWIRDTEYYPLVEKRDLQAASVLTPARGARFLETSREGDAIVLRCEFLYDWFRWKGYTRDVVVEVTADTTWSATRSAEAVRIQGRNVELQFESLSSPTVRSVDDLLTTWDVSHVWVRGVPEAARRFELDPRFEKLWEQGCVVTFRVRG